MPVLIIVFLDIERVLTTGITRVLVNDVVNKLTVNWVVCSCTCL